MVKSLFFLSLFVACVFGVTFKNPIVPKGNHPDPGAIFVNGVYYLATTTNSAGDKFPIHSSRDLVHWKSEGHLFKNGRNVPNWAVRDFWAPEIHKVGNHFVAYFSARDKTGLLCVGAAHATNVLGPYKDIGHPLIRNSTVGNIDATYFLDPRTKTPYLIWKEDGNGKSPPEKYTPLWAQRLSDDGLKVAGKRTVLLLNDPNSWEGHLVEAPWIIFYRNSFYLFYSANGYGGSKYAVGVAKSDHILGPYRKFSQNPILHSDGKHWSGPGHCSVLRVHNSTSYVMFYHSWRHGEELNGHPRLLMMDKVKWITNKGEEWPIIQNHIPSFGPTPVPK